MFCSRNLVVCFLLFLVIIPDKIFSFENKSDSFSQSSFLKDNKEFFINNRVLFRVKDNTITVMDVIHKMNLLFYKSYPHLVQSSMSKAEFYSGLWAVLVEAIIDDFLIVADAEEKKVSVDAKDVRREMERSFGDNLMDIISSFNMTEEDIFKIMERDLIVQKMLGIMVRSKVSLLISPGKIKEVYREQLRNYHREKQWSYVILTLESTSEENTLAVAEEIHDTIINQRSLNEQAICRFAAKKDVKIKISNLLQGSEKTLSKVHQNILTNADFDLCSKPFVYKKNQIRLFVIKEFSFTKEKSFSELEEQLHVELLEKLFEKEESLYREKLRKRFAFDKDVLIKNFTSTESTENLLSWLSK